MVNDTLGFLNLIGFSKLEMTQAHPAVGCRAVCRGSCLRSERKVVAAGNGNVGAEMLIKEVRSDIRFDVLGRKKRRKRSP